MKWHDPFRKTKGRIPKPWRAPGTYKTQRKWPLMPRQSMILHLYNAGLKTEEVAEIMQVTVETLRKHLARIYYKCGVHDRGAAIQKGIGYEHLQRVIQAEREAVAKLVEELDRDNDKHRNDNW